MKLLSIVFLFFAISLTSSKTIYHVSGSFTCDIPKPWCVDLRMWNKNVEENTIELLDITGTCTNDHDFQYGILGYRQVVFRDATYEVLLALTHNCSSGGEERRLKRTMSTELETVTEMKWNQDLTNAGITAAEDLEDFTHTIVRHEIRKRPKKVSSSL